MSVNVRDKKWIFEFLPDGAQKQAQLERALREKNAVEKELEKIYQEGPSEIARTGLTFEQLQKKISFSEKTKEEALQDRESLTLLMHRMEKKHEQQKTQILLENEELKKRVKALICESEEIANNRLLLIDEIDGLKRELLLSQKAQSEANHKCFTQVASLEQRHKVKERLFEDKLRNIEKMNHQSVNELREMLSNQQKMGFKWKDESQLLSKKFEETVAALRNEISKQSKRNDELSRELADSRMKNKQVVEDLLSEKVNVEKAQSIASDAETRAAAAGKQVSTLLNREKELLQDRKNLHKELEKFRVKQNRPRTFMRDLSGIHDDVQYKRPFDGLNHRRHIIGSEQYLVRDAEFDKGIVDHSSDIYLKRS